MSASMSPTRWPARASATARFAETVDLPTPPLPDEIARPVPRAGSSTGVGGGGTPPGPVPGAASRRARSGPAPVSPAPPATVLGKGLLLAGGPHRANLRRLAAEQPPNLLPRGGVGRPPGREARHLFAIVRLDRIALRLLLRRESDAFE